MKTFAARNTTTNDKEHEIMNNNQETLRKLEQMRLSGMARAFRATMDTAVQHSFTPDELISHLVDTEWDDRYNRKLDRLIKAAKFRYRASFEEIDLTVARNLDKNIILRLSQNQWIETHQNVLLTGPTGTGKSLISCALGHQACIHGFKTGYYSCSKLFKQLRIARADGSYLKALIRIQKQNLFILDDLGLEPFDAESRMALLEILEDRIGRRSSIIVSQIPISKWHHVIGDPTIADAICDRIVHTSHRIELKGDSLRKKYGQNDQNDHDG
ncbi:MAG: IS21-like element helper ATPase IstB [Nitrospinaceae bacterium]|jgi:DNA replication protein DnaC|nr:IS21-like element helper ATPase IstB [Nitrospinaceae bacterium]|tara:strand:- start:274 stop:1086 length:813 start_codon:yes stop_codon:yes gene_type:complete